MEFDMQDFGRRISNRRKEKGIKQNELAELLGISNNHMSGIERGRESPSFELFCKICDALDVNPDALLLGAMLNRSVPQNVMDALQLCSQDDLEIVRGLIEHVLLPRRRER